MLLAGGPVGTSGPWASTSDVERAIRKIVFTGSGDGGRLGALDRSGSWEIAVADCASGAHHIDSAGPLLII